MSPKKEISSRKTTETSEDQGKLSGTLEKLSEKERNSGSAPELGQSDCSEHSGGQAEDTGKENTSKENTGKKKETQGNSLGLRNTPRHQRILAMVKLGLLAVIVIGIPLILVLFYRDTILDSGSWSDLYAQVSKHPLTAFWVLILLQMVQIIICIIPGQPIQMASSYMYGIIGGYAIAIIGAIFGCLITYRIAHFLGTDAMHLFFGEERVRDYMHKLNSAKALTIVFLIYLIPGIPKDLVSYVAGISDVELRPFLIVSTLGRSPGVLGSLLIGAFWSSRNYVGIGVTAVFCLIIFYVCIHYRKRIMRRIESYEDWRENRRED